MPSLAPDLYRQGPIYLCDRQVNLLVSTPRTDSRKRVDLIATTVHCGHRVIGGVIECQ